MAGRGHSRAVWRYASALCTIALATQSAAFVLPASHGVVLRRSSLALSNRPTVTGLRAAAQSESKSESRSKAEVLAEELKTDLKQMFDLAYEPKWDLYAEDVLFKDPLNKFKGIQKYKDNIQMLKDSPLFTGGKMTLHEVNIVNPQRVDTRWTLAMTFKPFPWQPRLEFTGTTQYIMGADGLVVEHLDQWDALSNNEPVSLEGIVHLVGQMLPDIAAQGARRLRGEAQDAAPYTLLRKFGDGTEIRRYHPQVRIVTPTGEVYNKESYDYASALLLSYRGDALEAAQNSQNRILPRTEPALQIDSGNRDSYLAYLVAQGTNAPAPASKELKVVQVPETLVAVGISRGFGSDRNRNEEGLEQQRAFLVAKVLEAGFQVTNAGASFTLANYPDGYEMWLNVAPVAPN
jgi:hypothetical protein